MEVLQQGVKSCPYEHTHTCKNCFRKYRQWSRKKKHSGKLQNFDIEHEGYMIYPNRKRFYFFRTASVKGKQYGRTKEYYQCEACEGCPYREKCHKSGPKQPRKRAQNLLKSSGVYLLYSNDVKKLSKHPLRRAKTTSLNFSRLTVFCQDVFTAHFYSSWYVYNNYQIRIMNQWQSYFSFAPRYVRISGT